jgi:DNA (cytosine-5)-methyltransferase 1
MLQIPELKRAMGFPDGFKLDRGSRRDRIRLTVSAVRPPAMKAVVEGLSAGSERPGSLRLRKLVAV